MPLMEKLPKAALGAVAVAGLDQFKSELPAIMYAENFAWMRQDNLGCYIRVGNGEGEGCGCVVYNFNYNLNDDAFVCGASYWTNPRGIGIRE